MIKMPQLEVDEIDFQIACQLKDNSRVAYKTLGEKVNLSASSVFERTRKMEEKEVILGFRTEIDWGKFGYSIHAFIMLKDDQVIGDVPNFLHDVDSIYNCWMISGEYDYLLEIYVANNEEYSNLIDFLYRKIGRTNTLLIVRDVFKKFRKNNAEISG
jgi:DNA-binding Lrp family transcriptional regulator